jgi:SEC-C motif-containing protein
MRSRYSAYAKAEVEYLRATQSKPTDDAWAAETRRWTESVAWLSLEVVGREQGRAGDAAGVVEFVARYLDGQAVVTLRERSTFSSRDGRWSYDAGEPQVTTTKVVRNDPCPCGSGKKFKACHA